MLIAKDLNLDKVTIIADMYVADNHKYLIVSLKEYVRLRGIYPEVSASGPMESQDPSHSPQDTAEDKKP